MADTKISALTTVTSLADNDLFAVVDDPGGTPASRSVRADTIRSAIGRYWPQSTLESAAGITPSDYTYIWGDVRRYGAVADSASGAAGTDNTTAFQNAVNTNHPVYVPEGYFSIEGTIEVYQNETLGHNGGKTIIMSADTRLEKFGSDTDPIIHISGGLNHINGNGATIAVRTQGGYTKGVILVGADPAATDNTGGDMLDTNYTIVENLRILGNSTNTGSDGSIGMYLESPARKRGQFISPLTLNVYYNTFRNIHSTQFDYCFFISTDSNANHFDGCAAITWGTAAIWCNGYGNQFTGLRIENPIAQDTTERGGITFGTKDSGPETNCDLDATEVAISGITKGSTTTIDCSAVHNLTTTDKIKLSDIVDNGPDGDLETALNGGHFEVTVTDTDSFTIPLDTSGLTNTYSSGGNVTISPYPILAAFRNNIDCFQETQLNLSTKVCRAMLFTRPKGAYATEKTFQSAFGTNYIVMTGTLPGGVANSGLSDSTSVLNNTVNTSAAYALYVKPVRIGQYEFRPLDDRTADTFGSFESKWYSGRITGLAESTPYNVWTIDDYGLTSGCGVIKLIFAGKVSGDATEVNHAGEISWAVFNEGSTETAVKLLDVQSNNGDGNPADWSITTADGTSGSTYGKFSVTLTTNALTGTNNDFFYGFSIQFVTSQLEGSNLDWDADVTMLRGDQGAGP